jgi:hypothetical protein
MSQFSADELRQLATTDEVHVGFRPGQRIPIWIVVDEDQAYVRSVKGPAGKWYQALSSNQPFTLHGPSSQWSISSESVTDEAEIARVSEALNRKYRKRWPGPTDSMLRPDVLPTTLRIQPK